MSVGVDPSDVPAAEIGSLEGLASEREFEEFVIPGIATGLHGFADFDELAHASEQEKECLPILRGQVGVEFGPRKHVTQLSTGRDRHQQSTRFEGKSDGLAWR